MKMRALFIINAVFQLVFGLGFLLTPTVMLGLFGAQTDNTGLTLAHVAGAVIFSLAVISWLGKEVEAGPAQDAIGWGGVFSAHLLAGFLTLQAVLGGTFNSLAWSAVVLDALFVIGFFWARAKKA